MTTGEMLVNSRKAHQAYRMAAGRIDAQGVVTHAPQHDVKRDALRVALQMRVQAHEQDPDHTDPEWANDPRPHDELVKFYQSVVG